MSKNIYSSIISYNQNQGETQITIASRMNVQIMVDS